MRDNCYLRYQHCQNIQDLTLFKKTKDASEREIAIKNGLSIIICISMVAWLILKVCWGI